MTGAPKLFMARTALPPDDTVVRVIRHEERLVETALLLGELVYVRGPRKIGKTSLLRYLERVLSSPPVVADSEQPSGPPHRVVTIDLQGMGAASSEAEYVKIFDQRLFDAFRDIGRGISIDQIVPVEEREPITWFWKAVAKLVEGANDRFFVFVDEIEEVLRYRNTGEGWLTALRAAHQAVRSTGRFGVCLFGRLPAGLLVRSTDERTPFNTAKELVLPDFTLEEVLSMVGELRAQLDAFDHSPVVARAIYRVTSGQPNLTQCLLQSMREAFGDRIEDLVYGHREHISKFVNEDPECAPTTSNTYAGIDDAFSLPLSIWPVREALAVYARLLESTREITARDEPLPMIVYDPWSEGQRMLEGLGIAKIQKSSSAEDQYLTPRNLVSARIFDRDWLGRRLASLQGVAVGPRPMAASSEGLVDVEGLAIRELCDGEWGRRHHLSIVPGSGREIVSGTLYEFELARKLPDERLTLQMFVGVGDLGGLLWRRQVRTLRRLASSGRTLSLPSVYRGALLEAGRVAYIITQRPQFTLADALSVDFFRTNRGVAIEQLRSLAVGLEVLAEEGIVHRNIWPGAIRFDLGGAEGERTLKFANFEFAVMLRSIVAGGTAGDPIQIIEARRRVLREAFLKQPPASRCFAPPEHLAGLFGDVNEPIPIVATSDVFSLGMIAASWFSSTPSENDFRGVIDELGDRPTYDAERHAAFITEMQTKILRAGAERRIPRHLATILRKMIEIDPRARFTPHDVSLELRKGAKNFLTWASGEERPLLVCFSYKETAEQLRSFNLVTSPLHSEDSRRDVEEFIKRELRNARIYYSTQGVAPYVENARDEHRRAQWVLVGLNWLFYCQRYERRVSGFSTSGVAAPHALRIAYPSPIYRSWREIPDSAIAIDKKSLVVVEQGSHELDEVNDIKYSRWDEILSAISQQRQPASFELSLSALNWLVRAQREQLEMQRFPIVAAGPIWNGQRKYELDQNRYRAWIDADALRSIVYRTSNIKVATDLFELTFQTAAATGNQQVRLRQSSNREFFDAKFLQNSAAGITLAGDHLPDAADVELKTLRWARRPINDQALALSQLESDFALHDQLLSPHVVVKDDAITDQYLAPALEGITGRSRDIVRSIVETEPFSALQGPPGTGKTTVISSVVRALLDLDETARILVSAQSHAALDNLALRIVERIPDARDILRIRLAADQSFATEQVDAQVANWRSDQIARDRANKIQSFCNEEIRIERSDIMREALTELRRAASQNISEIMERIEESANLVFATTAGTARVRQGRFLAHGRFDMAIVDEASKAWPTEILLPLLLADRYLIVGDHKQLPAFGSTTIEKVLHECISSRRDDFQVLATNEPAVRDWIFLFRSLFEPNNRRFLGKDRDFISGWRDESKPVSVLEQQFRMRKPIADVVSHAFYNDILKTGEKVNQRERLDWIDGLFFGDKRFGREVVWIDTTDATLFRASQADLSNLDQAELAAKIVARAASLAGASEKQEHLSVVALSPYRRQNGLIEDHLRTLNVTNPQRLVHTVDSFQGQEADVVVLSLVRTPQGIGHSNETQSALQRLGFLVAPERVNVMLSRAREKLIILGDFDFFATASKVEKKRDPLSAFDLSFWERTCKMVESVGGVLPYDSSIPESLRIG